MKMSKKKSQAIQEDVALLKVQEGIHLALQAFNAHLIDLDVKSQHILKVVLPQKTVSLTKVLEVCLMQLERL